MAPAAVGSSAPITLVAAARGAALALVVMAATGLLLGPPDRVDAPVAVNLALAAGFLPTGLFLVRGLPRHTVARLVLGTGLTAAVAVAAAAWSGALAGAWLTQWTWWPPIALIPLTLLYFPDGQLPSRRWRPLAAVLVGCVVVGTLLLAAAALAHPRTLLTAAEAGAPAARALVRGVILVAGVLVLGAVLVVVALVRRLTHADDLGRRQFLSLLPAGVLLVAGIGLDAAGVALATLPAALALPAGIGVAVLKFRLGDLDLLVNRTLVWLVMSALVLAAFALAVSLIGSRLQANQSLVASAVATGAVAAGFDPVRRRVQRGVERLLYGDRDAPHLVLQRLGQRMQLASDPGAMLDQLVVTLADALHVPYVRMLVDTDDGAVVTAAHGRAQPDLVTFPMTVHGRRVGSLEVAPRRAGEELTAGERSLLDDVAAQAAIAAQAHRLTLALQRSRESLVRAREEERLRIRRDLHDGLGPVLVGTRMQVRAARSRVADDAAAAMLDDAANDLAECSAEVRRLVDGLRPPALDQGLEAAVRQRAAAVLTALDHTVRVTGDLTSLPAAVEVALYRIAAEAMSNVSRHSGGTRCDVEVVVDDGVARLTVEDDGRGGARARDGGVGLDSMRLRATELGGTLTVASDAAGTRVESEIPLR